MENKNSLIDDAEFSILTQGGVALYGTETRPKNPQGILILVHGSLLQTRDGDLDGSKT